VPIISVPDSTTIQKSLEQRGVGWHVYFTFSSNSTFLGFLAVSSLRMAIATGFKFGTVIDQVSTNHEIEIYSLKGPDLNF